MVARALLLTAVAAFPEARDVDIVARQSTTSCRPACDPVLKILNGTCTAEARSIIAGCRSCASSEGWQDMINSLDKIEKVMKCPKSGATKVVAGVGAAVVAVVAVVALF
ncbi:hypothetical protein Q8F55_004485 [Vanrija albida]|uniref:Extracellular membrane protein CFEM domain-containing protein n=1 Tax=Vanrija albida TaxID=181172 RepID=A0ABR3Q6W9_9TREE